MPRVSSRRVAQLALRRWRTGREFADAIIQTALRGSELTSADRAFALELFYSCLRNLTLLDHWIRRLRPAPLELDLRDVVRLGLLQLLLLNTSEHAAVFETVDLVVRRQRGVVNGILREALRQRTTLVDDAARQPLHVRASHPEFLVKKWRNEFGDAVTEQLCAWNNVAPSTYVRVNTLRATAETLRIPDSEPFTARADFLRVRSVPEGELHRGEVYVQDPSTALAPELLDAQPGDAVLDVCAAPGGKSAIIAAQTGNRAEMVACDRDATRLQLLGENLATLGVRAEIVKQDWTRPIEAASLWPKLFDRILVDAPCSNTGVMRRRVDVRWRLTPDDFLRMPDLQLTIVQNVAPLLRPGGVLVYSTCSIDSEENEGVVQRILHARPDLRVTRTAAMKPWIDGIDGAFAARFERVA